MLNGPRILSVSLLIIWLAFCIWYAPSGGPLSDAEVEDYIAQIRERATGPVDEAFITELRELTASDDGRAFVNVNLIRYRDKALYPPGSDFDDDPRAADRRYSAAILPYLLRHGAVPIWAGDTQGDFIRAEHSEHWDRVALVRYRSRRDLLRMVVALAGQDIGVHKWASIEHTQVFPAASVIHPAPFPLILAALLTWLGLLLHLALRCFDRYRGR